MEKRNGVCCPWVNGWQEDSEPCKACLDREFRILYDKCSDGRCSGKRDCEKHSHLWDRPPNTPTEYPRPASARLKKEGERIVTPYHRGTDAETAQRKARRKKKAEDKARRDAEEDDGDDDASPDSWRKVSDSLKDILGEDDDDNYSYNEDRKITEMARRIESRRIARYGSIDAAVGEPVSRVMGFLADPSKKTERRVDSKLDASILLPTEANANEAGQ